MTNHEYVPKIRLQSEFNGPLLGDSMYQYGFYDAGVLREVLNHVGSGKYKVWTLPIPRNEEEFSILRHYLYDPTVQYALVDKSKVVFVTLKDNKGWMSTLNELGYEIFSGAKTNKRLKSTHRPTLINARFDNLNIVYVDPDAYSNYDFNIDDMENESAVAEHYRNPEVVERLLDGGFVVSKRLIQEAVQNIPVFYADDPASGREYYCDPIVRKHLVRSLLDASVYNTRIIGPMGFLKGNAIYVDLPEGIDVITSKTNIKKEFRYTKGYRLLAEPQGSKSRVLTDDQTLLNLPDLFPNEDIEMWLREEYQKIFDKALSDNLLTNWNFVYQRRWRDKDDPEENEARARSAYVGYRWTAAGMKVTHSPWLFETTAVSHAKPLEKRVLIPCSVYEQVIPESLARMAGFDINVEDGTIIRLNEIGVHVVNDLDWLEMYPSHGGHDEDDFFKLFYREIEGGPYDGTKMVIVVRSPNGYGEYSMFEYVEGQWNPAWHKADGTEIRFPKIDGTKLPERLSHAIQFGGVEYSGLPSANKPKPQRSGPYTQEDVLRDVRIAMAGGSVGLYVNACILHSSVVAKHRPVQLCSLEDVIDKCINPDDEADVVAIDAEAYNIIREVIDSGLPVDPSVWRERGSLNALRKDEQLNLVPGKLHYFKTLCMKYRNEHVARVRQWAQANATPPEIVHQLGKRFFAWSKPILRDFRMDQYNANSTEVSYGSGKIERPTWETLYQGIVDKITQFERIEDRHDFVLGLYSATIKTPTQGGKITDQIVMNRFVYPYLEDALQYYGIALVPFYSVDNGKVKIERYRNSEFYWPDSTGEMIKYTDPLEYQSVHKNESPFSFKMKSNA